MGVFYHLRYPLLALDLLARLRPRLMVFQTLTQGSTEVSAAGRAGLRLRHPRPPAAPDWPHLAFIETTFCGDPTNWWVPNRAAVLGMLRAAGFDVLPGPATRPGSVPAPRSHPENPIRPHSTPPGPASAVLPEGELRMNDRRRIVVAGGAGFLGSHLVDRLLADGHEVICVDNFHTGRKANILHLLSNPWFELCRHDITMPLYVEVDAIYNLACPASPIHYQRDPVQTLKTCVHGSINLLGLAKRLHIPILLASTSEIYGDPHVHPQTEDYWGHVNPIGRRSCYDEGKRCAETLFFDYGRQYRLPIKVARIFNTYGPRMHPQDGRVVSNFIVQALKGEDITIYGDGLQTRSFCFVDDLVDGLVASDGIAAGIGGPINLGNPQEFTIARACATDHRAQRLFVTHRAPAPAERRSTPAPARHRTCPRSSSTGNRRLVYAKDCCARSPTSRTT